MARRNVRAIWPLAIAVLLHIASCEPNLSEPRTSPNSSLPSFSTASLGLSGQPSLARDSTAPLERLQSRRLRFWWSQSASKTPTSAFHSKARANPSTDSRTEPGSSRGQHVRSHLSESSEIRPTGVHAVTGTYAVFLFYTWNHDMFMQTYHSLMRSGFEGQIIVLDNSEGQDTEQQGLLKGAEVLGSRTALTFAQLQNVARNLAQERGLKYYFWAHSDVVVMADSADVTFRDQVIKIVEEQAKANPKWGLILFDYDRFAAYNTDAVADLAWDVFIPHYLADCDYYHRMQLAGWGKHEVQPSLKVFHMSGVLDLPEDYEGALAMLKADPPAEWRTHWRDAEFSQEQQLGRELTFQAAKTYYKAKWGVKLESDNDCFPTQQRPFAGVKT